MGEYLLRGSIRITGGFFLFISLPMEKDHSLTNRNMLCDDLLVFLEWRSPYDNCHRPGREPAKVW